MFRNSYQNGPVFEVFDSKMSREKTQNYKDLVKVSKEANVRKYFDKEMKSFLLEIDGYGTKLSLPREDAGELGLLQGLLVLQVYIEPDQAWNLQFSITDTSKTKRRVSISNVEGKLQKKYFYVRQHSEQIKREVWLNLVVDVLSFMAAFRGQTFRTLDQVAVCSHCRLRRIFTMKSKDLEQDLSFPKQCAFPADLRSQTQIIRYTSDEAEELPLIKTKVFEARDTRDTRAASSTKLIKKVQTRGTSLPKKEQSQRLMKKTTEKEGLMVNSAKEGPIVQRRIPKPQKKTGRTAIPTKSQVPKQKPVFLSDEQVTTESKAELQSSVQKEEESMDQVNQFKTMHPQFQLNGSPVKELVVKEFAVKEPAVKELSAREQKENQRAANKVQPLSRPEPAKEKKVAAKPVQPEEDYASLEQWQQYENQFQKYESQVFMRNDSLDCQTLKQRVRDIEQRVNEEH